MRLLGLFCQLVDVIKELLIVLVLKFLLVDRRGWRMFTRLTLAVIIEILHNRSYIVSIVMWLLCARMWAL